MLDDIFKRHIKQYKNVYGIKNYKFCFFLFAKRPQEGFYFKHRIHVYPLKKHKGIYKIIIGIFSINYGVHLQMTSDIKS